MEYAHCQNNHTGWLIEFCKFVDDFTDDIKTKSTLATSRNTKIIFNWRLL